MPTLDHAEVSAAATAPKTAPLFTARPRRDNWLATIARKVDPKWWAPMLHATDGLLVISAFALAYWLRYDLQWFRAVDPAFQVPIWTYAPFAVALMIVLQVTFRLSGVYPYKPGRSVIEDGYKIAAATTIGVVFLIVVSLAFNPLSYSRLIYLYTAILVTLLVSASRIVIGWMRANLRQYGIAVQRVLLVGAGEIGRMVMRTVAARPDLGLQIVGFLDDNPSKASTDIGPFRALGPIENCAQTLEQGRVDRVIVCLPWQSQEVMQGLIQQCEEAGVNVQVVPDFFQLTRDHMRVEELNGIPLISKRDVVITGWNYYVKRTFDLLLTFAGGLLLSPFLLAIAIAIKLDSPGPVFYAQERVGKNGKLFRCFKFRSMVENADQMVHDLAALNEASGPLFKVRSDPRRTRVGRFLRRYSIDELPQLWNVVRGEMSIVGPRPNLPEEVAQYDEWHRKRLLASPGVTGLWQVSGRSDLTFDEMVLLDIYYVENWNILLDINILFRSIPAVLRARGAY